MSTTVWIASLRRSGAHAQRPAALLAPPELERARRFVQRADRERFVLARAIARRAAASALRCDPRAVAIELEPSGRPRLAAGAPALSIAHGGDLVAVAFAAGGCVGVDIEPLDRAVDIAALVPLVCGDAEARELAALEPGARRARFLSLWTLKEACLKATGDGLLLDPRTIVFALGAGAQAIELRRPPAHAAGEPAPRWSFTLRPDCEGHVVAVALHTHATGVDIAPAFVDAGPLLAQ